MDHPPIFQFNAFCGPAGSGNPGAACLLSEPREAHWMQRVAVQMNLPMTAFLHATGPSLYAMRWFDPDQERPLCGHATLGAAHVLWNELRLESGAMISFQTVGGLLQSERFADGIEIALPLNECAHTDTPAWMGQALKVAPQQVLSGQRMYLVELANQSEVAQLQPDFDLIKRVAGRGIIVTARSDDAGYDIASRYFPGYAGNDEDYATGSAHCCLVPFWSKRLGKPVIRARQLSARGGEMSGRLAGAQVKLRGRVASVLAGKLLLE